MPKPEP